MNRKVLIEVISTPNDEYVVMVVCMADADRTPLLRLRVHSSTLHSELYGWGVGSKVDAEIVAR